MLKTAPVQIKAAGPADGLAEGQFRALVSVFGNKDAYGDVVVPGAFTDTLAEWKDSGDTIPIYWSHQMQDPDYNVGYCLDAYETDDGLEVLGQLDLEDDAPPKARQVYRLLKGRRVTQFSFAYDVLDGSAVDKDGDSYFELRRLKLHEVGPTPIGANAETQLLGVKTISDLTNRWAANVLPDLKAGRVLSTKNENTLREALDALHGAAGQIENVLAAVSSAEEEKSEASNTEPTEQVSANDGEPVKDEDPESGKSEEPTRKSSVSTWSALLTIADLEGEAP